MSIRYVATTILAAGIFTTLGFISQSGESSQLGWIPELSLWGWAIAPYMAVMLTMKRFRLGTISRLTLLAAASLLTL
ncbi:MAG: hypothetical protein HC839_01810, partial [Leptolyngbyaceae cyanobacterium RM2_2_21]|nr:hypothetical protein [Leptolyngbyaceae cyanobacterium RM2_2_21]